MKTTPIQDLEKLAQRVADGHFTIMRFTTNWRCCLGTVTDPLMETAFMAEGRTLQEAIEKVLEFPNLYSNHTIHERWVAESKTLRRIYEDRRRQDR